MVTSLYHPCFHCSPLQTPLHPRTRPTTPLPLSSSSMDPLHELYCCGWLWWGGPLARGLLRRACFCWRQACLILRGSSCAACPCKSGCTRDWPGPAPHQPSSLQQTSCLFLRSLFRLKDYCGTSLRISPASNCCCAMTGRTYIIRVKMVFNESDYLLFSKCVIHCYRQNIYCCQIYFSEVFN